MNNSRISSAKRKHLKETVEKCAKILARSRCTAGDMFRIGVALVTESLEIMLSATTKEESDKGCVQAALSMLDGAFQDIKERLETYENS